MRLCGCFNAWVSIISQISSPIQAVVDCVSGVSPFFSLPTSSSPCLFSSWSPYFWSFSSFICISFKKKTVSSPRPEMPIIVFHRVLILVAKAARTTIWGASGNWRISGIAARASLPNCGNWAMSSAGMCFFSWFWMMVLLIVRPHVYTDRRKSSEMFSPWSNWIPTCANDRRKEKSPRAAALWFTSTGARTGKTVAVYWGEDKFVWSWLLKYWFHWPAFPFLQRPQFGIRPIAPLCCYIRLQFRVLAVDWCDNEIP